MNGDVTKVQGYNHEKCEKIIHICYPHCVSAPLSAQKYRKPALSDLSLSL